MIKSFNFKFIITLFLMIFVMSVFMPHIVLGSDGIVDIEYLNSNQFDDSTYDFFSSIGKQEENKTVGHFITNALKFTLGLVRAIALGWAILMAISISTKYMAGDAQIKSQIKTDLPTYVVGLVLLFGGAGIITLIEWFVEDITK